MTSKLRCPICGGDIQYNDMYSTYDCKNNPSEHHASEEVWQALTESHKTLVLSEQSADREIHRLRDLLSQSQKDLEIAINVIDTVRQYKRGTAVICPNDIAAYCDRAIEQIKHKE